MYFETISKYVSINLRFLYVQKKEMFAGTGKKKNWEVRKRNSRRELTLFLCKNVALNEYHLILPK